jgi:DNA-binding NarL/FixJ family response regulator
MTLHVAENQVSKFEKVNNKSEDQLIVLVDHRVFIRDCMVRCLSKEIGEKSVVAVSTLKDWPDIAAEYPSPDLFVLYLDKPNRFDEQTQTEIAKLSGSDEPPPIVLLSDSEDANDVLRSLEMGVRGVIPTSVSLDVAVEALQLVRAGGTYIPASSLISARNSFASRPEDRKSPASEIFTERQEAVVRALREGKANKIIAYELNMQESTVKVHVRNIMRKLKATNRTQVAYLTRHLFDDD